MVKDWREGGRVDRPLRHVLLHWRQVVCIEQHGGAVLGRGDQHAAILACLHVRDGLAVVGAHLELLASLDIPLDQVTIVVSSQQQVVQPTPNHRCDLQRK